MLTARYQASLLIGLCAFSTAVFAAPRSLSACFVAIDPTDKRFVPFCVARLDSTAVPQGASMVSKAAMTKIVGLAFAGLPVSAPPPAGSYKVTGKADAQPDVEGVIDPKSISSILGVVIDDLRSQGQQIPAPLCQLRKDISVPSKP